MSGSSTTRMVSVFNNIASPDTAHILVLDIDGTLSVFSTPLPELLDAFLVQHALLNKDQGRKYQGFVLLTHRHFASFKTSTVDTCINDVMKNNINLQIAGRNASSKNKKEFWNKITDLSKADPTNVFTSRIAENFSRLTGLPCLMIVTADDANYSLQKKQCSFAFGCAHAKYVKPWENAIIKTKKMNQGIPQYNFNVAYPTQDKNRRPPPLNPHFVHTKNNLLIPLAEHMAHHFITRLSFTKLELHYLDDIKPLSDQALQIDPADLPKGTTLHVYEHRSLYNVKMKERGYVCHDGTTNLHFEPVEDDATPRLKASFPIPTQSETKTMPTQASFSKESKEIKESKETRLGI